MDPTPMPASLRTVLIAVAGVLALVGATGLVTGAANADDTTTATGRTTTTTASDTDATLGLDGDASTTTTIAGSTTTTAKGSATTAKPGTTATTAVVASESNACTAPDGPGAAATTEAPPLGVYSYVNCTDGSQTADDKVEAGSNADGKTRRRVTASRSGVSVTEIRSYVDGSVIEEGLEIVSPYGNIKCDLKPDVVITPAPLSLGKQWSGEGSCDAGPPVGKISFSGSGKVTGSKSVTIGGTAVRAWVLETQITVVAAGQTQKTNGVSYFDPSRGLDLFRKVSLKDAQGNDQTVSMRLASLTPRAA
jgi:hypothetical protein